ncbi:calcium/sodium antiporter [Celerinatantimonas sp. YJH-8]|uniref:calcium/sodium antiporter n=1 Tax=Celerinatantimonas sp. YJH-8 TaxID=3228714 RepID=UPI0038BEC90D
MLIDLVVLILSFVALVWSADRFVFGAAAIARNLGISPMVIGLTVIAMGSSAPEIMVSATASLSHRLDTAIGNAIGSNITNITLVLGVTALLKPILVASSTLRREIPLMLLATVLTGFLLSDNQLSFMDGIILISLFIIVMAYLIWYSQRQHRHQQAMKDDAKDEMISQYEAEIPKQVKTSYALFWLLVGLIILPLSADYLVNAASNIARYFGISELVIGLTIIAIGTSLPELAASIASIIKKENDIALGNIIGSNIFNLLVVLSVCGILAPGKIDPAAFARDYWWMLATSAAVLGFSLLTRPRRITRLAGALFLVTFIGYQLMLFL